jgi:fluoride exporter
MAAAVSVAIGGALGGVLRYAISTAAAARWGRSLNGTFAVNVAGAFGLGVVLGALGTAALEESSWLVGVTFGFFGGFTTVSTFSVEALALFEERKLLAGLYLLASAAACLAAFAGGFYVGGGA